VRNFKRISGEAYDINKQTIYIAPKSKIESRVHYAPEPERGKYVFKQMITRLLGRDTAESEPHLGRSCI